METELLAGLFGLGAILIGFVVLQHMYRGATRRSPAGSSLDGSIPVVGPFPGGSDSGCGGGGDGGCGGGDGGDD